MLLHACKVKLSEVALKRCTYNTGPQSTMPGASLYYISYSNLKHLTRAGVYETLCPQHTLAFKDNLEQDAKVRKGA